MGSALSIVGAPSRDSGLRGDINNAVFQLFMPVTNCGDPATHRAQNLPPGDRQQSLDAGEEAGGG